MPQNTRTRLVIAALLLSVVACVSTNGQAEQSFQQNADIVRLRHAAYYSALIAEYHERTGTYPLQREGGRPKWVFVAHEQQMEYTRPGPAYAHERVSFAEFVRVLETGLGREIDEHYDPQFVPVNRPNFYTYVWADSTFFFTVHLHGAYAFANRRGPDFSALVVSNRMRRGMEGITPDSLRSDAAFAAAAARTPERAGFWQDREATFLHDTKKRPVPKRESVTPRGARP